MTAVRTLVRDIVLNGLVASYAVPRGLRWRVLRALGMDVQRSSINAHVFFGGRRIRIGRDVFVNYDVFLDNAAPVTIGDRVSFGQGARIVTGTHAVGGGDRRAGPYTSAAVTVEEGAWVGAYATILPGVTVGRGALVAAGALVTRSVPPDTLVAGVPARVVRSLPPLDGAAPRGTPPGDDTDAASGSGGDAAVDPAGRGTVA